MSDQSLSAMVGLWDKWEGPEGILESYIVIIIIIVNVHNRSHHQKLYSQPQSPRLYA